MLGLEKDQMIGYRDQAISALQAVMLSGSSYEITHADGSKQRVTRANIAEIQEVIHFWQQELDILEGLGGPLHVRPNF
ncbi:MAG: hypothetical protein ISR78_09135 [Spirochaetia bacterium]|nr:hypothetical protein [Spirochaetia bacterium]